MAKQINTSVGGVVKKVKEVPLGVGGVVKKAKVGKCGIGGVVKEFYQNELMLYNNGTITNCTLTSYTSTDGSANLQSTYILMCGNDEIKISDVNFSEYSKLCIEGKLRTKTSDNSWTSEYPLRVTVSSYNSSKKGLGSTYEITEDKMSYAETRVCELTKIPTVTREDGGYYLLSFAIYHPTEGAMVGTSYYTKITKMWLE